MNHHFYGKPIIPAGKIHLQAELTIPVDAGSIIIFAEAGNVGSPDMPDSIVAARLLQTGYGVLVPRLLTEEEKLQFREFDIPLLTSRLLSATDWLVRRDFFKHYRFGYFASAVGAAAALQAAAGMPASIGAIVCRSGRTDLAMDVVPEVQAPTLLIAGSMDRYIVKLNRECLEEFSCEREIEIVQGAGHLFGNGKIEECASLACRWFAKYLVTSAGRGAGSGRAA